MQVALLKEVVSSITGANTKIIVDLLYGKKNVNEFLIAKKLKMTINQTRNVLYKLLDEGLVSFERKKDRKKGGWYVYFWTLNTGHGLNKFKEKLTRDMGNLKEQLHIKRTKRFLACPNCHMELSEEDALINEYTCPECGQLLEIKDGSVEASALEKEILKLGDVLEGVSKEVEIINLQNEKTKVRRNKLEEKKKQKIKEEKRKVAKKEKSLNQSIHRKLKNMKNKNVKHVKYHAKKKYKIKKPKKKETIEHKNQKYYNKKKHKNHDIKKHLKHHAKKNKIKSDIRKLEGVLKKVNQRIGNLFRKKSSK